MVVIGDRWGVSTACMRLPRSFCDAVVGETLPVGQLSPNQVPGFQLSFALPSCVRLIRSLYARAANLRPPPRASRPDSPLCCAAAWRLLPRRMFALDVCMWDEEGRVFFSGVRRRATSLAACEYFPTSVDLFLEMYVCVRACSVKKLYFQHFQLA